MNTNKFLIIFLVAFCAQAGSENWFTKYAEIIYRIGEKAVKLIHQSVQNIGAMATKAAQGFLTFLEDASKFINRAIETIEKYAGHIKSLVDKLALAVAEVCKDVYDSAKNFYDNIKKGGFMYALCNTPCPKFVTKVLDAKDEICNNPVNLMGIKDRVIAEFELLKDQAELEAMEFARDYKDKIIGLTAAVISINLTDTDTTSGDAKNALNSVKDYLIDFNATIADCTMEKADELLDDAFNVAGFSTQFLQKIDKYEKAETRSAPLNEIFELVKEVKYLTDGLNKLMGVVARKLLDAFAYAQELCNKLFDIIRQFIADIPEKFFGGDDADDDNEGMSDLQILGEVGSGALMDALMYIAKEILTKGLQFVEKILDAKKDVVCGIINATLKGVLKVSNFVCAVYRNDAVPNNTLIAQVVTAHKNLMTEMVTFDNYVKSTEKGRVHEQLLRAYIIVYPLYKVTEFNPATYIADATEKLSKTVQDKVDSVQNPLLSSITKQLIASAKKCSDNEMEFSTDKIDWECAEKNDPNDECTNNLDRYLKDIIFDKIEEINEGLLALKKCINKKKEYGQKKYQSIKKNAKKVKTYFSKTTFAPDPTNATDDTELETEATTEAT